MANAMAKRGVNQRDALHNWHLPLSELHDLLAPHAAGVVCLRV